MSDETEIAISRFRQVIYTDYTGVIINDTPHQRTRDKSPQRSITRPLSKLHLSRHPWTAAASQDTPLYGLQSLMQAPSLAPTCTVLLRDCRRMSLVHWLNAQCSRPLFGFHMVAFINLPMARACVPVDRHFLAGSSRPHCQRAHLQEPPPPPRGRKKWPPARPPPEASSRRAFDSPSALTADPTDPT